MIDLLDRLDAVIGQLAHVDLRALEPDVVGAAAVRVARSLERLKVEQARVLVEADRAVAWKGSGARNAAGWLADQANISYGDAARQMELGDTLDRSPALADAVRDGSVPLAAAGAVRSALADPELAPSADELVDLLAGSRPNEARTIAEHWSASKLGEPSETERAAQRHARRALRFAAPVDGMVAVSGHLTVLDARVVRNAIEALAGTPSESDTRTGEQRRADALVDLCHAWAKGQIVGGRNRPTVLVTIDAEALFGHSHGTGCTDAGEALSADAVRRLCCDADIHRVVTNSESAILDLGRAQREPSREQYLALVARDGGCRVPGCDRPPGWCDAHHIRHWTAHVGDTDLENLVLLCRHHHTVVHLPGWQMHGPASELTITRPDGTVVEAPARGRQRRQPDLFATA